MQPGDTFYIARQGDNLEKIAKRYHMDAKTLAMINQVSTVSPLTLGQSIIIPTHQAMPEPTDTNSNNSIKKYAALTPGDTIYMVRPGDTIEKIAAKFHTSPANIRLANLLGSNQLEVGDQLVIPTHV